MVMGIAGALVKKAVASAAKEDMSKKGDKGKKAQADTSQNFSGKDAPASQSNSQPKKEVNILRDKNKRMPGTPVEQVGHNVGPVRNNAVEDPPVDITLNQMANMPQGTDVQGAIGVKSDLIEPEPVVGIPPEIVGGQAGIGQTMVDDKRNQELSGDLRRQAEGVTRNEPVPDPNADDGEEDKPWYKEDAPPAPPNITPEAGGGDFLGAGAQGYTQTDGGTVNELGTSGITGGGLTPIPGMDAGPAVDRSGAPITSVAESDRFVDQQGQPLQSARPEETDSSGRVKRPAFWKVALDAIFGGMPLIPGSKLATIPLARAREDYYKQDKRDQELTDTFLKEMGEGDWKRAQQLAKTGIFRDAVTRTMNMTPDDLISLDQQIQENSTTSLSGFLKKIKTTSDAAAAGYDRPEGSVLDPEGQFGGPFTKKADIQDWQWKDGIAFRTNQETGDLEVAMDVEKDKQDQRIQALMEEEGMSHSQAVLAEQAVGKGIPRFKQTVVGNGVVTSIDQFSGNVLKYKFSDAVKADMGIEIFKGMDGVPLGYFMYDKSQPVPTDMNKVTPVFFKNMLWGNQKNGKYTWWDAMKGRNNVPKEEGGGWLNWISKRFGGLTVTDNTPDAPQGDESQDYSQGAYNEVGDPRPSPAQVQQAPQGGTTSPPNEQPTVKGSTATQTEGVGKSEREKSNKFFDVTG